MDSTRETSVNWPRIVRFVIIGALATLTHGTILALLVEFGGLRASLATLIAFCLAFCVSYFGHRHVTFRSDAPHHQALPGFVLASITGALLNATLFVILTDIFRTHYALAFLATVFASPPVVYVLSKALAFGPQRAPSGLSWRERAIPLALFGLAAIYTLLFYFRLPYFDHWDIVPLYAKMQAGTLMPADLFVQHGSHWHTTGYIVMLANGALTGMNHLFEVIVNLALAALGFAALVRIFVQTRTELQAGTPVILLLAVAAYFHFSLDQAANFLWGWQVALFASTTGTLWCIALLMQPQLTYPRLALAALCAMLALYGFATAWTLAPIGLALIGLSPATPIRRKVLAASGWLGLFALAGLHFAATRTPYDASMLPSDASAGSLLGLAHYTGNFFAGAIARISRPLGPVTAAFGLVALTAVTLTALKVWRKDWIALRGLGALTAFAFGAALLTALGRYAAFGPDQAFANRYISFANNGWMVIAILALLLASKAAQVWRLALFALVGLLCLMKAVNLASAINTAGLGRHVGQTACALVLNEGAMTPEQRQLISSSEQSIDPRVEVLQAERASLFRPGAAAACD